MSVSQISVFTESKPGHLSRILANFHEAGVNVRGYSVSDTGDYGIARFIVDDIEAAKKSLQAKGNAYTITQVICTRLEDKPGELAKVFDVLGENGINVKYSYSMISTYIVVNVEDIQFAKKVLFKAGIETITQSDIARIYESSK